MARREERDPYTPPPMHHDRSGAVVRIAIVAVLLAGAVWGYTAFQGREQTALVPEVTEEQQMADAAGYAATPNPMPEALAPETAPADPTPEPTRRAAPAPADPPATAEPAPPPSTTSTPTTPAPVPPVDVPPAG